MKLVAYLLDRPTLSHLLTGLIIFIGLIVTFLRKDGISQARGADKGLR